jgi:hypothetical protein
MAWIEFYENINVALRAEVIPKHGTKQGQSANVVPLTKFSDFFLANGDSSHCYGPSNFGLKISRSRDDSKLLVKTNDYSDLSTLLSFSSNVVLPGFLSTPGEQRPEKAAEILYREDQCERSRNYLQVP